MLRVPNAPQGRGNAVMIMLLRLWVLFLTCLACRSLPSKLSLDSAKCSDILVQCKVAHFEDLVLDFSLTHPRSGSSTLHPVGPWKPDALANLTQSKNRKHAIPHEQANHAFLSLTADTYGKLSDDFVRFLWMLANSASTNSRFSQPSSQDFADSSPDSFAAQVGSSFSRIRVRVGAAVAKAAAARFMPDSADDSLPVPVFWNQPTASKRSTTYDLPLFHKPC
jgi:hypothetical protein